MAPYVPPPREINIPPHVWDSWFPPVSAAPPPPPPMINSGALDRLFAEAAADAKKQKMFEEAKKSLDVFMGNRSVPATPVPAAPVPAAPVPTTFGGGMQMQLPMKVPAPVKRIAYKGLDILWDGVQWVVKHPDEAAWRGLSAYGNIELAARLASWAYGKLPTYKPPQRVDTSYSFSGSMGMSYKHFDGSWQVFPPAGYDRFGNLMR